MYRFSCKAITVEDQIKIIKEAAKQAGASKAQALQFLKDAGIAKDTKAVDRKKESATNK